MVNFDSMPSPSAAPVSAHMPRSPATARWNAYIANSQRNTRIGSIVMSADPAHVAGMAKAATAATSAARSLRAIRNVSA